VECFAQAAQCTGFGMLDGYSVSAWISGAVNGRVAERLNAPVLKTGDGRPSVGSNPTPSANSLMYFFDSNKKVFSLF
jgi:hypothetical protein